jgi:hypothetical protein
MLPSEAMAKAAASRARWSARGLAFVVPALAVSVSGSCAESKSSFGEQCLKDEDCLSGICAQQLCVAAPSIVDGSTSGIATPAEDAPVDVPSIDSPVDALGDAPGDRSSGDVGAESGADAVADVADAVAEAPADVAADVPVEAKAEAGADAPADSPSVDAQPDSSADGAEGG